MFQMFSILIILFFWFKSIRPVCFKSKEKAEKSRAFKNRQIPSRETLPIKHQLGRFHQTFIAMGKGAIKSDNINRMIQLPKDTTSTSKRDTATNFQN